MSVARPQSMKLHTVLGMLAATCLSFWQVGCNGSSNNTTQQPGVAAPSPSPSGKLLEWSLVQERTSCQGLEDSSCIGAYGFAVLNNGSYFIGPGPSGESLMGHLDGAEFDVINQDALAVATDSLTPPYTCTDGNYIPGVQDNVTIDFSGNDVGDVIYREYILGLGSSCYIGNESNTLQLHADLRNLLGEYYPVPFPSSTPSPSPTPSTSPTGTPLPSSEWGGTGVEMTVSPQNAAFQFNCSSGQTVEPIFVDSSEKFSALGVYDNDQGPIVQGDPREYAATYSGTVQGGQMNLTITYTNFIGNSIVLHFTLVQGQDGSLNPICPFSE
jgi:hypothetical protein